MGKKTFFWPNIDCLNFIFAPPPPSSLLFSDRQVQGRFLIHLPEEEDSATPAGLIDSCSSNVVAVGHPCGKFCLLLGREISPLAVAACHTTRKKKKDLDASLLRVSGVIKFPYILRILIASFTHSKCYFPFNWWGRGGRCQRPKEKKIKYLHTSLSRIFPARDQIREEKRGGKKRRRFGNEKVVCCQWKK